MQAHPRCVSYETGHVDLPTASVRGDAQVADRVAPVTAESLPRVSLGAAIASRLARHPEMPSPPRPTPSPEAPMLRRGPQSILIVLTSKFGLGHCGSISRNASAMISATTMFRYHLRFAGITYHGAICVLQRSSTSSYARM